MFYPILLESHEKRNSEFLKPCYVFLGNSEKREPQIRKSGSRPLKKDEWEEGKLSGKKPLTEKKKLKGLGKMEWKVYFEIIIRDVERTSSCTSKKYIIFPVMAWVVGSIPRHAWHGWT